MKGWTFDDVCRLPDSVYREVVDMLRKDQDATQRARRKK